MSSKKYGLIMPDKTKKRPIFEASRNVFGNDDDSDDENKSISFTKQKKQIKVTQEKAVKDDPTIYQYDEIYDNIKEKKSNEKLKNKDKNPKYIESLLKSAHKRKLENERRIERQVQKEREKEGDEFADKEVFVTSAYKKKLEEMREEEEREKREDYLEKIGDVTKQKDLGGFYRHLYEQKLGTGDEKDLSEPDLTAVKDTQKIKTIRNYRKRKVSQDVNLDLSDGEIVSDEEINRQNLLDMKSKKGRQEPNIDADSDFSVNDPSEDEHDKEKDNINFENKKEVKNKTMNNESIKNETKEKTLGSNEDKTISIPKIDIWKKRTVGTVFEECLKRYYERKAGRNM